MHCTTQSCQKLLYRPTSTKKTVHCQRPSFPYTLYCWITLVFSLFWQLLCWLSFSEATCLAVESLNKVGDNVKDGYLLETVTWWKMIHQFAPKCVHNNRNLILSLLPLPLPNTNTRGEAFNNLTVSIIEAQACLKWWQGVSKMHLKMQVHYWFFLDMVFEHVCSTSVSVWSTVSVPFDSNYTDKITDAHTVILRLHRKMNQRNLFFSPRSSL